MAEFETRIDVGADPESVFDYLADPVNMADWDPNVRSVEVLAESATAVGSTFVVTVGFYGKAVDLACETTTLDRPTRIEVSLEGGRADGRLVITIEPGATGSTITYRARLGLKGAARILDRGLRLALAGMGQNAAEGLRKQLGAT